MSGSILDGVQAEMAAKGLEVADTATAEAAPKKRTTRKTKTAKAEETTATAE